jgi:hypothetical protein
MVPYWECIEKISIFHTPVFPNLSSVSNMSYPMIHDKSDEYVLIPARYARGQQRNRPVNEEGVP